MASRGVNKVILIGHMGRDPEVRYTPSGNAVANLSVATTRNWRDKQTEEQQERTEWHRVVLYGRLAEISGEYLRKGDQVYLEGRLETRKWQDSNQQDRWTTEVIANEMTMLGGRRGGEDERSEAPSAPRQAAAGPAGDKKKESPQQQASSAADFNDDLPF